MILKSISTRSSIARLVKYIFKENKVIEVKQQKERSAIYKAGIRLTAKDQLYLEREKEAGKLLQQYREFVSKTGNHSYADFIKQEIMGRDSSLIIKHNMRSLYAVKDYVKELEANEANRAHTRSNQVRAYHTILSWSKADAEHLTNEKLKEMAEEYINLRGINNKYLGAKHIDKDHVHLHLIVSATQLNGRSSRISKQEFERVKIQLQDFQKERFPELISLPEHGKSKNRNRDQN